MGHIEVGIGACTYVAGQCSDIISIAVAHKEGILNGRSAEHNAHAADTSDEHGSAGSLHGATQKLGVGGMHGDGIGQP
jgi:hypothetical protein